MKRELCFVLGWASDPSLLHSVLYRSPTLKSLFWSCSGIGCCEMAILSPGCLEFFFLSYLLSFCFFFFFSTQKGAVSRLMGKNRMEGGRRMSQLPWYRAVKGPSRLGLTCVYNPER